MKSPAEKKEPKSLEKREKAQGKAWYNKDEKAEKKTGKGIPFPPKKGKK